MCQEEASAHGNVFSGGFLPADAQLAKSFPEQMKERGWLWGEVVARLRIQQQMFDKRDFILKRLFCLQMHPLKQGALQTCEVKQAGCMAVDLKNQLMQIWTMELLGGC